MYLSDQSLILEDYVGLLILIITVLWWSRRQIASKISEGKCHKAVEINGSADCYGKICICKIDIIIE